MRDARSRRCFHRVMSGLERGGSVRFLTLTSAAPCSEAVVHRHFRALMARLERRGLVTGYIQCPERTRSGLVHKHVLFRGSYVEQRLLSEWWRDIHGAPIVDIRRVRGLGGDSPWGRRKVASYMAKYMAKGGSPVSAEGPSVPSEALLVRRHRAHYSWSAGWVWRGFCGHWARLKRLWSRLNEGSVSGSPFATVVAVWNLYLHRGRDALVSFLSHWEVLTDGPLFRPGHARSVRGSGGGFAARMAALDAFCASCAGGVG